MIKHILDYFKTDRTWDTGVKLYFRYSRNKAFMRKIQVQGETRNNADMLHYQLWRMTGLPERQLQEILRNPVEEVQETEPSGDEAPEAEESELTVKAATRVKLRDKFPFLRDDSCPDVLKILVSDMLTAHDNYVDAHAELYRVENENEAFQVADKLIDNYLENREIWEELAYFQQHGEILGNHRIFREEKRLAELREMQISEVVNLKDRLEMNIWRNQDKIKHDPKPHLLKTRQERIAGYEWELRLVKKVLGIDE